MSSEIVSQLSSKQLARLIPVVAESKKEERATSTLLASFMIVPGYATSVLSDAGASIGKRSKITCYTEVQFKTPDKSKASRPDGLIVVTSGSKTWTALVESKIGTSILTNEQVEEYLALAKGHKIDAVITISNQFATTPSHHPLAIPKSKRKGVELYHFSWLSLKSKAVLLSSAKEFKDPEQAYVLGEVVRYFDHDSSGVAELTRMPAQWKDLCASVQNGVVLNKNMEALQSSVSGWHQLMKHLSLGLGMVLDRPVEIHLSRQREKDAELNFSEDCICLVKDSSLTTEFQIPNAAARVVFSADFLRRVLKISMKLDAPKDRSRASASINWLTRQFKGEAAEDLSIRAYWPKRIPETMASLSDVLEDATVLIPPNVKELPTAFDIVRVVDLGARFKGSKTFVEDASAQFPRFYQDAGQHLTKWVAQAPKIREKPQEETSLSAEFSGLEIEVENRVNPVGMDSESDQHSSESM